MAGRLNNMATESAQKTLSEKEDANAYLVLMAEKLWQCLPEITIHLSAFVPAEGKPIIEEITTEVAAEEG